MEIIDATHDVRRQAANAPFSWIPMAAHFCLRCFLPQIEMSGYLKGTSRASAGEIPALKIGMERKIGRCYENFEKNYRE